MEVVWHMMSLNFEVDERGSQHRRRAGYSAALRLQWLFENSMCWVGKWREMMGPNLYRWSRCVDAFPSLPPPVWNSNFYVRYITRNWTGGVCIRTRRRVNYETIMWWLMTSIENLKNGGKGKNCSSSYVESAAEIINRMLKHIWSHYPYLCTYVCT